ncbi:hypothetical protein ACVIIV_004250 [Bradyrhizobium sp. USDA 4354]
MFDGYLQQIDSKLAERSWFLNPVVAHGGSNQRLPLTGSNFGRYDVAR